MDSITIDPMTQETIQQAIFAGGCFWCVEALLKEIDGILTLESGYIGGTTANPDYESVCSGRTGHAEAVRVSFRGISYADLLQLFMVMHDPTTLNAQGNDKGTQYRSAVFPLDEEQEKIAREVLTQMQSYYDRPIVTTIEPAGTFYKAEAYHQDYFAQNPNQPYCAAVIAPKVAKLRQKLTDKLQS